MRKNILFVLVLIGISNLQLHAQQNPCAALKSANTVLAMQANAVNAGSVQEVLMNKYDLKFHHLNINVERTSTFISGWVRTLALVTSPLDTFAFELHNNLSLDSVFSGTTKLIATHVGNFCFAKFPGTINSGVLVDMKIYYHGTPPTPGSGALGAGFTNAADGNTGYRITWSLSQPYSAEEWWPCKQSLKDKIDSSYVFVTTDSTNKVGSNGLLKNTVIVGIKKRYEWHQVFPIDYYLISVAVGQYYDYSFYAYPVNTPPVLIQNYFYNTPSTIANMKPLFDNTKPIIELYCKLFGPYAFAAEKYGHCMAPLGGGMEHQTMTTIGAYSYNVIAHELGHQWFGDAVTCATWSDIWVNEGFATYTAFLALQYLDTTKSNPYMVNSHNSAMNQVNGSVWCTDTTNVGRIFSSSLTYDKGSSMIHMLRFELNNDSLFFNILKEYIRRFKGGTASGLDFKKVVEDLSGKDFTQFFNQWLFGEGYPMFNVLWNQIGTRLRLLNVQGTSFPSSISLFKTSIEYKIRTTKGDTIIRFFLRKNLEDTVITIKDQVLSVQVDPNNWLLCKSSSIKDPTLTLVGIPALTATAPDDYARVYPNPANDKISILKNSFTEPLNYSITDATGRVVLSGILISQASVVDISSLIPGFYFIQFGGSKLETLKLMKR